MKTDLSRFNNSEYQPGDFLKRSIWFLINAIFFNSRFFPFYGLKKNLLKLFGAKVGEGLIIKPHVNIKYPWKLILGNHVWIGEGVWIDNLENVEIGNHVCLSQESLILCGNHNYKSVSFDLMAKPIQLEDGVWIGARAIVCGGVICKSHAVLTVNSVATKDLQSYSIYQGNPAEKIKDRIFKAL